MALIETTVVRLDSVTRLRNTPSGNARYTLHCTQHSAPVEFRTKANSAVNFDVENIARSLPMTVTLTLTPAGFVSEIA